MSVEIDCDNVAVAVDLTYRVLRADGDDFTGLDNVASARAWAGLLGLNIFAAGVAGDKDQGVGAGESKEEVMSPATAASVARSFGGGSISVLLVHARAQAERGSGCAAAEKGTIEALKSLADSAVEANWEVGLRRDERSARRCE